MFVLGFVSLINSLTSGKNQLRLDLTDAPIALASLDISNAHTSVARIATYISCSPLKLAAPAIFSTALNASTF